MCLRASVYLSLLGKEGLRDVARQSARAAQAFCSGLDDIGLTRTHNGAFFNEFVVDASARPELWDALRASGFVMGIPLTRWWPEREHQHLVALTELHYPQVRDLIQEVKRHAHDS
jgi:glycine dehydrogenase subunit 1